MHRHICVLVLAVALLFASCTVPVRQRSFNTTPKGIDRNAQYLKAHLRNGDLYLLTKWSVDAAETSITGTGDHYDAERHLIAKGPATVPIDSVALFETNVIGKSKRVTALSVMTGVTLGVAALCAVVPKACFGSCPTFFTDDGQQSSLQAEGFSASIAPSLEATDLDALYRAKPSSSKFKLRMTNEAMETHVVRSVRILAAAKEPGERVFATAGQEFWASSHVVSPSTCTAAEGECSPAVRDFDAVERFSAADRRDLSRHETIDLQFDPATGDGPQGVVIAARQTLLSTYLLYQALAYLGTQTGDVLAAHATGAGSVEQRAGGIARLLGGIDVLVQEGGRWRKVATFNETGPLATDVRLLPLPKGAANAGKIRLSMTRGLWRIDYVAMASLDRRVEPVLLTPVEIRHDDHVVADETLVTLPGDVYDFVFDLPGRADGNEIFLQSRGYYLEWMRDAWMAEESRLRAAMMFYTPRLALRVLAPQFKDVEPQMESQFWNSRYATHQ